MKTATDIKAIGEQTSSLKREQPELYAYLAERDALLVEALLHVASRIPDPADLPDIRLPLFDLIETESCNRRWFQPQGMRDDLEIELPDSFVQLGRRAEWLCEKGIRLRKTRLREIAEG